MCEKLQIATIFSCVLIHQVEQLTTERDSAHAMGNKADTERAVLERQNAELRAKLADQETETRTRFKTEKSSLEGRITNLQEQLDTEAKYYILSIISNSTKLDHASSRVARLQWTGPLQNTMSSTNF